MSTEVMVGCSSLQSVRLSLSNAYHSYGSWPLCVQIVLMNLVFCSPLSVYLSDKLSYMASQG